MKTPDEDENGVKKNNKRNNGEGGEKKTWQKSVRC